MTAERKAFERERLALFERYGATMTPVRVPDRQGRETYVLDSGGGGDPLVLVHGGGSEGSIWAPIVASLAEERRVLVPDRPGCGLSYPVAYGGFDYGAAAVEWMADLLAGSNLDEVDVLANSMGGFFALSYGLSERHRIRRLVLAGAPAGLDRWLPYPLRLLGVKGVNRLVFALSGEPDLASTRSLFDDLLVADGDAVDDELLEVATTAQALPGAEVGWRTLLEECVTPLGFRKRYMIRDRVAELDVPTLFLWGEEDAFAPPSSGEALAARMPGAALERVEGAGHLPWLDRPEPVVRSTRRFLTETVREQRGTA